MKKIIFWLVALGMIAGIIYLFISNSQKNKIDQNLPASSAADSTPAAEAISISGMIFCAPAKVVSNTKCLIGLEDNNNLYYALINPLGEPVSGDDYMTGAKIAVVGTLIKNSELLKDYNIAGVIKLRQ